MPRVPGVPALHLYGSRNHWLVTMNVETDNGNEPILHARFVQNGSDWVSGQASPDYNHADFESHHVLSTDS